MRWLASAWPAYVVVLIVITIFRGLLHRYILASEPVSVAVFAIVVVGWLIALVIGVRTALRNRRERQNNT